MENICKVLGTVVGTQQTLKSYSQDVLHLVPVRLKRNQNIKESIQHSKEA